MLVHYLTLGLVPGATDAEIRQRYLELTRRHPPARDPERFRRIATAYEALRSARARMDTALFGTGDMQDPAAALRELIQAAAQRRPTPGLRALLRAEGLTDD